MYSRLAVTNHWLDAYGLTQNTQYDVMLRRMAGINEVNRLRELVDIVEAELDGDDAGSVSSSLERELAAIQERFADLPIRIACDAR